MKELIKIQHELKAPKNQFNKFGNYNYRNAEDILESVKPLLNENGLHLILTDKIKSVNEIIYVEATAKLFKDEVLISETRAQAGIEPNRKGMDISQSFGSSSSYARKYALNGLFLIDDTKDADATHGKETDESVKQPVKIGNENKGNPFQDMKDTKNRKEAAKVWGDNEALQKDKEFLDLTKKTNIKFIMLSFKKKLEDCIVEKQLETEYTEILVNKDYRTLPVKEKEQLTEIKNKLLETFK